MAHLTKKIVTPYFGNLPEWWDKFEPPTGYSWLLDTDLESFKKRVKDKLGIDYPSGFGDCKVWDYRCALGFLYEEELNGFDFWLTMDFDVVFGDVNKFFPDEELDKLDVWSNHDTYVAGFWSLYRNSKEVNELFMQHPDWKNILSTPQITAWVENEYSRLLENSGLRYKYSGDLQGNPYNPPFNLIKDNGRLFQFSHLDNNDDVYAVYPKSDYLIHNAADNKHTFVYKEIPMLHFRRTKSYPL